MPRSWWWKFSFLLCCVTWAGGMVFPTLSQFDLEKSFFPFKKKMNLGLDLQGGLYLVLGVDFNRVFKDVAQRQARSIEDRFKEKKIPLQSVIVFPSKGISRDDPRIELKFAPDVSGNTIKDLIKKEFKNLRLAAETPSSLELGISHEYRSDVRERTLGQSIEVIRNRIDEFGVAEPSITSQGTDRVVVELPGVREIDRAKELIGQTAKLEFKIVDDQSMSSEKLMALVAELEKEHHFSYKEGQQKFSEYVQVLNEFARKKIPEHSEIAFERGRTRSDSGLRVPYLLFSKAEVTGDDLQDASVGIDPETQRPHVNFALNPQGASLFDKLTGDHIGHRLAIVLDNIVHSAPIIQTRISGGHGQISLGRGDGESLMTEARDLSIVLRAGALPAQLDFLEQRVVGPSLGQDSIRKGALASLIGSLVVFIFVSIYYRVSGLIAVFSLVLNVLFVLACLVGMEATLTLPGIAGIALTVGIAVDSNVVIYERIREELRLGKKPGSAVDAGFSKAFRTILDANVTNAAAAVVLLLYGTGPIKGFAVTLMVGILTTLFTAVFVCRLIFDFYIRSIQKNQHTTLSI